MKKTVTSVAAKPHRRSVEYQTLDDFRKDVEHMAAVPHETVGNWTFAQILYHLSVIMKASLDGFPFQFPWIVRRTMGPILKWYALRKPMQAGFKLPKSARALMPPDDANFEETWKILQGILDRYNEETANKEHPILGKMTNADWDRLHCRHNAMHMSFVAPKNKSAS